MQNRPPSTTPDSYRDPPSVVIGCSGSTGSSLLKTILNRHSQIFAGPEAALFAFPKVYTNWDNCKNQLLDGIKTDAWQLRKGMSLVQPTFGWEQSDLQLLIQQSPNFQSFVESFFTKPLKKNQKKIWVAKTPANAIGLAPFLQHFPEGKAVQTVRNPYDTITSLMARGINAYYATAYYVYNTAVATSNLGNERYYHLKYEDLVAHPEATLIDLFQFLKLPFEPQIIVPQHEKRTEPTAMPGWKNEETAAVKTSSINRFQEIAPTQQALIKAAFTSFRISKNYQKKQLIRFASGEELCAVLGYNFHAIDATEYQWALKKYYWKDRLGRLKRGFPRQFFEYLGELRFI
ncbi:MAG: sulfotransferase [Bacteroidota bacterium]